MSKDTPTVPFVSSGQLLTEPGAGGGWNSRFALSENGGLPRVGIDGSLVSLDWRVLLFTIAIMLVTSSIFGMVLAWHATPTTEHHHSLVTLVNFAAESRAYRAWPMPSRFPSLSLNHAALSPTPPRLG
jgi:hypothetical protein